MKIIFTLLFATILTALLLGQSKISGKLTDETNQPLPGSYEVEFNSAKLSSGVYYYQIKSGNFLDTKKMVLIR